MKKGLEGAYKNISIDESYEKLFNCFAECTSWITGLKLCYIIHKLIHSLKRDFTDKLLYYSKNI